MSAAPAVSAVPSAAPPAPFEFLNRLSRTKVWTTPPDSKICTEYSRDRSPDAQTWNTREECEAWVKQRVCDPSFHCYDGCNWHSCDDTGSRLTQTLLECSIMGRGIRFKPGTADLAEPNISAELFDWIKSVLKNPKRRLRVIGYADEADAASEPQRQQLAQQRAEHVRKLLIKQGLAAKRLSTEVGDPKENGASRSEPSSLVVLRADPSEPMREDFDPSSPKYKLFCRAP